MNRHAQLGVLGQRLLGVGFIALVVAALVMTWALYNQSFTERVPVTLKVAAVPDQFDVDADVKVDGMLAGKVTAIRPANGDVEIELGLDPDKVREIPNNVSAQILPKTLFGERYVALERPAAPEGPIAAGAVIDQDRTRSAIEVQRVLDGLDPLLRQVPPEKLSATLNAVATGLSGQGEDLGETMVLVQDYLQDLNPALPDIKADISELADAADTYSTAGPDLLDAAADFTVTSKTIAAQRNKLASLYPVVSTTADDLARFLARNKSNFASLARLINPTLALGAKYAPQLPCTMENFAVMDERLSRTFGGGREFGPGLYLELEVGGSRGKYVPNQDEPEYLDKRGPYCVPGPPPGINASQYEGGEYPRYSLPGGPLKDGSVHPLPQRYQDECDPIACRLRGRQGEQEGGG